ncbi:MAG: hypothetical protein ISS19_10125, partial [Bacteroidales bacterium]|nr:hypothetical protein [Bacteroidales bacterium]
MILKFRYIVVFFLAFVCFAFQPDLHAQEYPDSVNQVVGKGSGINLNLLWYAINHGDIQWQTSPEGISWSDIPEETSKNLLTTAHSDMYYRAKIQSGTCDPLYSKITRLDIVNLSTISVDSVSVNSAQVSCAVYPEEYDVAEQGIFLDTEPYPDIYSIKVTDSTNIETFTIPLSDLTPGETYYVRTYARLGDDTYMFGNILSFSTLKISASNRINISDTTVRVFYQLSSTPSPEEHGVFYSTLPGPDSTSMKVIGIPDDNRFYAEITGLDPSTVYFAVPYMKVNGKYYMAEIIEFKTFSDYSQVEVDTTPFTINHKIIWDDPSTGKKISQDGYYAEYGRVRRIGDSDTLLLVHHGGPYNGDWVNISLVKSFDNGLTWTDQEILMDINDYRSDYWRFCCPE